MEAWVKGYIDSDGKTCTLYQMVKTEPEWSANRIKEGEKAIADLIAANKEVERLREFARDVRDNWDCDSDAHKYGTSCRCCMAEAILAPSTKVPK